LGASGAPPERDWKSPTDVLISLGMLALVVSLSRASPGRQVSLR